MLPVFDDQDYHRKMLELQEKLKKCEESRIRLEERFNLLEQESRIRHESCINKLRMRYIEFLEEQRMREERNSKLLGALERIDSGLAVMSAKTDKLCTLKKEYEASMVRNYLSRRQAGSVTGDSGIVSRNDEKIPRKPFHASPSFPSTSSIPLSTSPSTIPRLLSYPERPVIDHHTSKFRDLEKNWYTGPKIGISSLQDTPSRTSRFLTKNMSPFQYPETIKPLRSSKIGSILSSSNFGRTFDKGSKELGRNSVDETAKTGNIIENELDEYISKIRSLHGDLDQSLEEVEQNTSGDLLNVSFSDDGVEQIFPEEKSKQVPQEVENVLKIADELAKRKINDTDIFSEKDDCNNVKLLNFEKVTNSPNKIDNLANNSNSIEKAIDFGDNTINKLTPKIASNVDPNLPSINEHQLSTSTAPDKIKMIAPVLPEIDQSANEMSVQSTNSQRPVYADKEVGKCENSETIPSTNFHPSDQVTSANSPSDHQAISDSCDQLHENDGVIQSVTEANFNDKFPDNSSQNGGNSNSVNLASDESISANGEHKNSEDNKNIANDQAEYENDQKTVEMHGNNGENNEIVNIEPEIQGHQYPYQENYAYEVDGNGTEYAEVQYDQQNYDPNQQNYNTNDPNVQYQADAYADGAEQYNAANYPEQQNIDYSNENYQQDPNNPQYLTSNYDPNDPNYNQQYDPTCDQQANQYNYENQYEGSYQAEGQEYTDQTYADNYAYEYDQNYQQYPPESQAEPETAVDTNIQEASGEKVDEVLNIDDKSTKKKKDVIKSILESETESSIEKNTSHTESDFDFN